MEFVSSTNKEGDEKGLATPRPSLQTLSDLIFGLALSIGALSLIGQQLTDFSQILVSLSFFALGFYLLVSVWYRYASIMKVLPFETSSLVILNMLLLFLVAIEPYLLNVSTSATQNTVQAIRNPVSQLYAIDFGSIYIILAYFLLQLIHQERKPHNENSLRRYKENLAFSLVLASVFFISALPFFETGGISYFNLRQLMWIALLPIGVVFRLVQWLN